MMAKTHREIIIDALNYAERNCRVHFGFDESGKVNGGVMADIENTCLNYLPETCMWSAIEKSDYMKLSMAIRSFLSAHKCFPNTEISNACETELNKWDNKRFFVKHKGHKHFVQNPVWWEKAVEIYKHHFLNKPDCLISEKDWNKIVKPNV